MATKKKAPTVPEKDDNAKQQAKAQMESIMELVANYERAGNAEDDEAQEKIREEIRGDALSVEVRTDWHDPGCNEEKPTEGRILLCTGGPAVQIIVELNEYCEPEKARLEYQDWFTPWTHCPISNKESDALLIYCGQFWFGE